MNHDLHNSTEACERQETGCVQAHSGVEQPPRERGGRGGTVPPRAHRFKKGQSGNPKGRPKEDLHRLIRSLLMADEQRLAKEVTQTLIRRACAGNPTALRELLSRAEPRVPSYRLRERG